MPRRTRVLLLLFSFLFVCIAGSQFTKRHHDEARHSIDDVAFTSQLFSGSWRNVVALDSKAMRERKERQERVFHLGNADDAMRKREEEEEEGEEEDGEKVPLLKTLSYEEKR